VKPLSIVPVTVVRPHVSSALFGPETAMFQECKKITVDNCAAHPKDTSFLRNVKVIQYPANCTSVLQPLDLGVINSYKQLYRKRLVQTAVYLMDAGKDTKRR
jgi:hypothetical protein